VWMGKTGLWLYVGYVCQLNCDLSDYVLSNINALQISKTYAVRDSANAEVIFFYCSSASTEIDSAVVWNYRFGYWSIGRKPRLCGTDRGVFVYPIFVDSAGLIYEHEVGFVYDGTFPYAEGGPLEFSSGFRPGLAGEFGIGAGDAVAYASWLLPDDRTLGDVTATIKTKFVPEDAEVVVRPVRLAARTEVRFAAPSVDTPLIAVSTKLGSRELIESPRYCSATPLAGSMVKV